MDFSCHHENDQMKNYTLQYVIKGKQQNKNVPECRPGLVSTSAPRQKSCTKGYPSKTRALCASLTCLFHSIQKKGSVSTIAAAPTLLPQPLSRPPLRPRYLVQSESTTSLPRQLCTPGLTPITLDGSSTPITLPCTTFPPSCLIRAFSSTSVAR